jgi:carboxylesterase type B
MLLSAILVILSITLACASPVTINIQKATVNGVYDPNIGVDKFLGLKYATALRFKRATAPTYSKATTIDATSFGVACPQIKGTVRYECP